MKPSLTKPGFTPVMALKLTLKPGERVAVNGAVIVNGDRRSTLVIENQARVLRERDILKPENADTPAKRVYLPIMLMYLDPEDRARFFAEFELRLTQFAGAVSDAGALRTCAKLAAQVANNDYYKALATCRALIDFEKTRLADVA
ncbi:MAG: flagellar biosynthesis repressor FlbT [Amphiplicatus sp.]